MNPAFECSGDLLAEDILAPLKRCKLPALITDTHFMVIAKNKALTKGILPVRKGSGMDVFLGSGQLGVLQFLNRGQVEHIPFMAPRISGAVVARFVDCYFFAFKTTDMDYAKEAAEIIRRIDKPAAEAVELTTRLDRTAGTDGLTLKQGGFSQLLRRENAGYMLKSAAGTQIRLREYFPPSEVVENVYNITKDYFTEESPLAYLGENSSDYCYGIKNDLYRLLAAMLAFALEYSGGYGVEFVSKKWDNKQLITVAFKNKAVAERLSAFLEPELPFAYNPVEALLSERMLFLQCLADSNGWYFCPHRDRSEVVLTLTMALPKRMPLLVKRPPLSKEAVEAVRTQFMGFTT